VLTLCVMTLSLLAGTARAELPELPAEVIKALRDYSQEKGDLSALLQAVVPKLATVTLELPANAGIQKGGPIPQVLSAEQIKGGLDASPGSLPMVLYKQEDGRMPGAWIIARYKRVKPAQVLERISDPKSALRHPLVDQHFEVAPKKKHESSRWGEDATHVDLSSLVTLHMPFGAGMFGLRDSYAVGDAESVLLPNGIGFLRFHHRALRPEERTRHASFQDKKGRTVTLDDTHFEAREYMLASLLVPEKDASGVENTIHVYFTRIVAATKPGTTLKASDTGASSWVFVRGARDGLVTPVKLIRDEVERQQK
jgi:hypothetical protein